MITHHRLNDGTELPAIGLGTYPMREEAPQAVATALQSGYRLLDTAATYGNEREVGQGIARSGVPREEVVVTTKLRGRDQGYGSTLRAFDDSCTALGLDHIDLYLIHWPLPRLDAYVDSWRAMIELQEQGRVRSIGVSNFLPEHLDRLAAATDVVPAVNQVELHPYFPQHELREDHARRGILTQSWRPLGRSSDVLDDARLARIAAEVGVSVAQVMLRWHVQLGAVPIPKSSDPHRQRRNLDVFGFELSAGHLAEISAMQRGRLGGDPAVHEEF